ncbi:MAG: hypothetical protein QJR08_00260 [Bacillota bacterium]|nr:hypothetical protein [Bacillota bacterium]
MVERRYQRSLKMIAVYVTPAVYEKFERAAKLSDESISSLAAKLVLRYLDDPEAPKGELPLETVKRLERAVRELYERVEALEAAVGAREGSEG